MPKASQDESRRGQKAPADARDIRTNAGGSSSRKRTRDDDDNDEDKSSDEEEDRPHAKSPTPKSPQDRSGRSQVDANDVRASIGGSASQKRAKKGEDGDMSSDDEENSRPKKASA